MKIIITDLTRFSNEEIVCVAGINPETNRCIRPMPYLQTATCQKYKILPGAIIEGDFSPASCTAPHIEDCNYQNLKLLGSCNSEQFKSILVSSSASSVEEGFGVSLALGQKHIPDDNSPAKSIITLQLLPQNFAIMIDKFQAGKLRVTFSDSKGKLFKFLSLTDLGFFEYYTRNMSEEIIAELNDFIHSQQSLFIRLGLSRSHQANDGRSGFWMQVNGIYTFPEFKREIRCYNE